MISKKQHKGESLDKFRKRRKASNNRRRQREKQYRIEAQAVKD